jgi:hypothetical protein
MVYDSIIRQSILDAEKEQNEILEVHPLEVHNFDFKDLQGYGLKQDESGNFTLNEDY